MDAAHHHSHNTNNTHRARLRPGVEQLLDWPHKLGRPLRWFATLGYRVAAALDGDRQPVLTLVRIHARLCWR